MALSHSYFTPLPMLLHDVINKNQNLSCEQDARDMMILLLLLYIIDP